MTREELERRATEIIERESTRGPYSMAHHAAGSVIALVVEACCDDLKALAGPAEGGLGRLDAKARVGVLTAALRLRQSFLPTPTKEQTDG